MPLVSEISMSHTEYGDWLIDCWNCILKKTSPRTDGDLIRLVKSQFTFSTSQILMIVILYLKFFFLVLTIVLLRLIYFLKSPSNSPLCVCRNHRNEPIDWFIIYKFPLLPHSIDPLIANGTGYIYLDSSSSLDQWHFSSESITSSFSLTGLTLGPLYQSKENSYMFYNDQPPNHSVTLIYGHSKGVLALNDQSGYWLVHSVPHFPPIIEQGYGYPDSGRIFGQTMLCLTLNTSVSLLNNSIDFLSRHFLFTRPFVFASSISSSGSQRYPLLANGIIPNKVHITNPPFTHSSALNSSSMELLVFGKYGLANMDMLGEFIVPSLGTSMLSETWSNGGQINLPSNCTGPYHTENIEKLSFNFTVHQDHSKWLVSVNQSWICIGDMNRQMEQKRRHGGFVCLNNNLIQERFKQLVLNIESCPKQLFE